jgi:hypothetical protein
MKYGDVNNIKAWEADLQGVFTMSDLKILFGKNTEAALYKKLNGFIREGVLIKVMRGLYATPGVSLEVISSRINLDSYISTGTVLARNLIIGSVPARKIQAMKIGRSRVYNCQLGVVEHIAVAPELYFGFEFVGGIRYATPEKAFLDACYLYFKGKKFAFDLDSDVNRDRLRWELLQSYLSRYESQFTEFFNERWR